MRLPWPEIESLQRPGENVREILDYLSWITREMRQIGYHSDADRDRWRRRVHRAYAAFFLPPLPGHGDPYPPDVPPAESPGIWPDIPAVAIPGMTVRHQLKVVGMLAEELRDRVWIHTRPPEIAEWDRRLASARELLDHGPDLPLPESARTEPSPEVLAEAQAQEQAVLDHARRRAQRLDRLRQQSNARKKDAARAKGKAAGGKAAEAAAPAAAAKERSPTPKPGAGGAKTGPRAAGKKGAAGAAARQATSKTPARPKKATGATKASKTASRRPGGKASSTARAGTKKATPARKKKTKAAGSAKKAPTKKPSTKKAPTKKPAAKKKAKPSPRTKKATPRGTPRGKT